MLLTHPSLSRENESQIRYCLLFDIHVTYTPALLY